MSIQAVFKRIHHFATVDCNMPLETRLKCIAKECEASLRNENACPPEGTRVIQCPHCLDFLEYCEEGQNYPCERCGILWRFCRLHEIEVIDAVRTE